MLGLLIQISERTHRPNVLAVARRACLVAGRSITLLGIAAATATSVKGAESLQVQGGEVSLLGAVPGEQVRPDVQFRNGRGVVVFEDNFIDGDGQGIGAAFLSSSLTHAFAPFRVNSTTVGDQRYPQTALLPDGRAAFVWTSTENGKDVVRARFLNSDNTFTGDDIVVSSNDSKGAKSAKIVSLSDGNVAVVWASFGQDDEFNISGSLAGLQGIYGRIFDKDGSALGDEFLINQSVVYNQRDPDVSALSDGGFMVAWVGEGHPEMGASTSAQQFASSGSDAPHTPIDIYVRAFSADGDPVMGEIKVNEGAAITANPALVQQPDGNILVAWSRDDFADEEASWDVGARLVSAGGAIIGDTKIVNSFTFGDQFGPQLANIGAQTLAVWTSLRQDGSFEGVFGQLVAGDTKIGDEFQVNTLAASKQIHPSISPNGTQGVSVVWSSFQGGMGSFDLAGKSFFESIPAAPTPFVSALSQSRLSVTWPEVEAFEVEAYLLQIDGSEVPMEVDGIYTQINGLAPGSAHSFRLAYRLTDGRISPMSEWVTGETLAEDNNFDGLPDDWQEAHFGSDEKKWPFAHVDSDGDGASNLEEFWAGTSPVDPGSVLKQELLNTGIGLKLRWNTVPGYVYQVEYSTDLSIWEHTGKMRFSHGEVDELPIDISGDPRYFRVHRLR